MNLKLAFCLIYFFALGSIYTFAQSSLEVFSSEDLKFTLYLNGKKINQTPETNVSAQNLPKSISIKVVFEDKAIPAIEKSVNSKVGELEGKLNANYGSKILSQADIFEIKKAKKGKYELSLKSSARTYEE
jgi:hypothetical protein